MRTTLCALLVLTSAACAQDDKKPADDDATKEAVDTVLMPRVKMSTTLGDIVIELNADKAPISTLNFLEYVEAGHYDGLVFHRIIPTFMIQGGGHLPDLTEKKEGLRKPIFNEWKNGLKNKRGTIAMARTQQANSATAQFFINVVDNAQLDQPRNGPGGPAAYAVFGQVVDGMDTVDKIKAVETKENPKVGNAPAPLEPVIIEKITPLDGASSDKVKTALEKREKAQLEQVIASAEKAAGAKFRTTDSGLMILTTQEGSGESPKPTDKVKVKYAGRLVNGFKFDANDQGVEFGLNQVIPGWTEGVGMMKVGEKAKLIIPAKLGYGERGAGTDIPPGATLVFDVELLSIG